MAYGREQGQRAEDKHRRENDSGSTVTLKDASNSTIGTVTISGTSMTFSNLSYKTLTINGILTQQ
jgi:hypothetical protein